MADPTVGGNAGGPTPESRAREDAERAQTGMQREIGSAQESLSEARRMAEEGTRSLVGDATQQARSYADSQKEAAAKGLQDFAEAVRRASDELGRRDQTLAARFVQEAAGGLETLSRTVSSRDVDSVIDTVRDFGRSNPAAFIAGSVLAGIAIGRFARASHDRDHQRYEQHRSGASRNPGSQLSSPPHRPAVPSTAPTAPGQTAGAAAGRAGGIGTAGPAPTSMPGSGSSATTTPTPGGPGSPSNQWQGR